MYKTVTGIGIEVIIVCHTAIGVPALDQGIGRQPIEKAFDIKDLFKPRSPLRGIAA